MAVKTVEKIGKYDIIEVLGKGAMGVVYKALDPDINREVAIKTIRFDITDSDDEEVLGRFMREAQASGKLDHTNIATIYEVGRENELTYIVMQYIRGQSLQQLIATKKKFSPKEINDIMIPLGEALEYAHQNGIVHRDIKPANILIDLNGKPSIVDFGVARVETSTLTQSGMTVGTPSYMSPEQIMGKKVDNRADIFSLGVILYELASGQRPFSGGNISTLMYKIVNEEPPHITEVEKSVPANYESIVEQALAKDPKDRFQSCLQFVSALKGESIDVDSTIAYDFAPDQTTKIAPSKKKSRGLVVGVAAAALLIGIAGVYFFVIRPNKAPVEQTLSDTQTKAGMKTGESMNQENPSKSPAKPSVEEEPAADPHEEQLAQLKTAFDGGRFDEAIKIGEAIIREDSANTEAQDYVKRARQQKDNIAIAAAKNQINQVIERQRQAEESEDLLLLLNDVGPSFQENRREAATFVFNNFQDIKSTYSNISITLIDSKRAEARFSFILTGVGQTTKQKGIIDEGDKTWLFEKQGNNWIIVGKK